MTEKLNLPDILNIPPKLYPMITDFNQYDYILLVGGRGSSKTQSAARVCTYIAEERKVRIVCGREILDSIEDSVYTVLTDLIDSYNLAFDVKKSRITHKISKSTFKFKGFRERGAVNVKGLEGVDILWIDEAQSITKTTLDTIIPTIRKAKAKIIFTMNRYLRSDAVYNFLVGRKDCLVIHINYFENPFCPLKIKHEAETMKNKSERDYNHIYLGHPLESADDFLFDFGKLEKSMSVVPFGDVSMPQRVMGIDFAAQGNDQCVATILDRRSPVHWEVVDRIAWDESNPMVSTGKIVDLIGKYKPDVTTLDIGGMGYVVHSRLIEVGMDVQMFDGGSTEGIDKKLFVNTRAEAYYTLKSWFDDEYLIIHECDRQILNECEKIRIKFRSDGKRVIQSKKDMKDDGEESPDSSDSLMMAVWGAVKHLGRPSQSNRVVRVQRVNKRKSNR